MRRSPWSVPLLALLALNACEDPASPPRERPDPSGTSGRVVGVMEVRIWGIGTSQVSASLTPLGPSGGGGARFVLTPVGEGGIQVLRSSASVVDVGARGAGGMRYLQANFDVRNASNLGIPYDASRTNLTLVPVEVSGSIDGTPVILFQKQDGTPADPALAVQLRPTGAVGLNGGGQLVSQFPDVLQAFTEAEVAEMSAPRVVENRFPYGFVVRRANGASERALPANPLPNQFDGRVTFAYKIPLAPSAAEDPFTIAIMVLAVDDSETKITQSLEEQDPAGAAAFAARAQQLGANPAVVLPGSRVGLARPRREICQVRTAGTPGAPLAFLFPDPPSFVSMNPNPYAGAGSFIARNAPITATYDAAVPGPVEDSTFVVNGLQSGRHFLGGAYTGAGTATVGTPVPAFFPGEEVEVSLTLGLRVCPRRVARLRVAAGAARGTFAPAMNFPVGDGPEGVAVGDLNGDGRLDLALANFEDDNVSVLLGTGGGAFAAPLDFPAGDRPFSVAVGDLNGDGVLDLAVANFGSNDVSVLRGTGGGAFAAPLTFAAGESPVSVAVGDLNGDGRLDLALANSEDDNVSVLLSTGGGGFAAAVNYPVASGPRSVALGDLNGDGRLDLATANDGFGSEHLSVLFGL